MSLSDTEDVVVVDSRDICDFNEQNILPLPAEELKKIRDWLQPTPYDLERSEFSRHRASYLAGTGQWLLSTTTYQKWHQGDANGLLWIKGIPGSGKSVMAASIIDQLRKEEVPVLSFFFRQIIDANHQPVAALRDWLCQMLPYSPPLQVRLKDDYLKKSRSVDSLSPSDLWKDLKLALAAFPKAYCVTDALDEMDQGNDDFLHDLAELGQWRPANVKVLITSRPVIAVESPLRQFRIPHLRLEERLVDIDIAAYVQYRLRNSSVPHEYWDLITEAVPGRANGLFLHAKLSMDAFVEPEANAQEVLEKLPADLNVMYNNLLREHAKRSHVPDELQLLVLQFVTHATRPLRLLEIAEMVQTTHALVGERSLKETKDLIRAACGPLLEVLHDETVSVVHHSFTEFLKGFTRVSDGASYPILETGPTNQRLAMVCLGYLQSGCLDNLDIKQRSKQDEFYRPKKAQQSAIRLQFPFLEYAAENWYIHTRRAVLAGADMSSFYMALDTFMADNQRFTAWLDLDWPEHLIQGLTPLHVAARTGLAQYTARLLAGGGADPNAKSFAGDPPLYWAASAGHADVAQLLIDNGADPDGEAHEGYKPLHIAATKNRAGVVKVLLAAGVDPLTPKTREKPGRFCGNAPRSVGHTPLMYACQHGHAEAVAEFLPYLTDPETLIRALSWSAGSGHAACVDLIVRYPGVDANSKYMGETPLFKACNEGSLKTIKVLLRAGADPNTFNSYPVDEFSGNFLMNRRHPSTHPDGPRGYTALQALCGINKRLHERNPTVECVPVLLEAGADVHLKSPEGKTALHYACETNIEIAKLLLDAGADPTAEDDRGNTILHTDGSTDKELLPLVLDSGLIDIRKLTAGPLHCRINGLHIESVLEFLKYKPNVNATGLNGNGSLHVVVSRFSTSSKGAVIDALLSAGADPNLQNQKGETPLHLMIHDPQIEMVSKLVNAGANIELRDAQGQTALFKSVMSAPFKDIDDRPELFKTLIELGARLDTRDNKGRTILHHVVRNTSRLKYLIGIMDFDPSVVDNKGNTLFLEAASKKKSPDKVKIYRHLKKLGVDIEQPNNHGKTVLHKMCARKPEASSWKPALESAFDYVLQVCKNPSPQDVDGIQPLHIAAAVSEIHVFKLLNAGANVFSVTNQGMTVLHIAARARQPGIIGLIISHLAGLEDVKLKAFLNQKNAEGNAALHYACSSGRPETVNLLLDAGADPNLPDKDGYTPFFQSCVEFEVEQARWKRIGKNDTTKALKTASVLISNTPLLIDGHEKLDWRSHGLEEESGSTRLDEILISLDLHGANIDELSLRAALHTAVSNQRDYTAECLLRLQSRFPNMNFGDSDNEEVIACKVRLEEERSSLREKERKDKTREMVVRSRSDFRVSHTLKLLGLRQYDLLEQRMPEIDISELNWRYISLPHRLVSFGLSDLLDRVCPSDAALKFDDHEWCNQAEDANHCHRNIATPLLITACRRHLPNMAVVRLLVEKMGVNINAKCRDTKNEFTPASGVLHELAGGKTWWNVHQALPYLIRQGADLELRNEHGETPLHIALDFQKFKGVFYKEAVRILLKSGADVNAVNSKGETCLSKAGTDLELIELLLSHGAKVSPAAIFSAIELQQVEILELFLSQGDYANMRRPKADKPERAGPLGTRIEDSEMYPLLYTVMFKVEHTRDRDPKLAVSKTRMMTTVLQHGADPYATYIKLHRVRSTSFADDDSSGPCWEPKQYTIIHEILSTGDVVQPLFQLPFLELERRDARGQTLLFAASQNSRRLTENIECANGVTKTPFQELLDRGADITAQDTDGKTILHNLIRQSPNKDFITNIKALLARKPSLVCVTDNAGDSPLHYVLRGSSIHLEYIDLLLEHGADPLQPDSNGDTALHILGRRPLTYKGHFKRFQDAGVDINARNKKGNTPLFKFVELGSLGAESFFWGMPDDEKLGENPGLLFFKEAGADFFARNHVGSSLLHVLAARKISDRRYISTEDSEARIRRFVAAFRFLMDMGLDPMLEDVQQRTSLDVAAACGNEHLLKLFERKPME